MAISLGIGIITCDRKDVLAQTLARLRTHTTSPCTLAVADDGSTTLTTVAVRQPPGISTKFQYLEDSRLRGRSPLTAKIRLSNVGRTDG